MPLGFDHGQPPRSPYRAYIEESRQPLTCLIFTLPLFLAYHAGVALLRTGEARWANGADFLIARTLRFLGVGGPLVSFFVVVTVFLFLHQIKNLPWRFPRTGTLVLMFLESLLFALPPFLLGKLLAHVLLAAGSSPNLPPWANVILSMGAGVYEEFLFRMVLMGALFLLFKHVFRMRGVGVYIFVMLLQAVLFALFHYLPQSPETFSLYVFAFRTISGVYFAYLYQERGFGVAAGSHAVYDLIAVLLNVMIRGRVL